MNIYDEAIERLGKNKTIQFMCKHESLDVDFTPKTMECFVDIVNNDDNSYCEETDSYNYEEQSEKDVRFFEGETVKYGDYYCYIKIVDNDIIKALERAKKVEELLGLKNELISFYQELVISKGNTRTLYKHINTLKDLIKALEEEMK